LHSDIDTVERVEIIRDLRLGQFDVLVGINLLREGLDMPEVALVAILDADKEGFLRSEGSLIQTIGRAARNADGRVILYADKITGSMQRAMDETQRRRMIQMQYNKQHGITPTSIKKQVQDVLEGAYHTSMNDSDHKSNRIAEPESHYAEITYQEPAMLANAIKQTEQAMYRCAEALEFEKAAQLRDKIARLKKNEFKL